jgi:uncharacterized repeat protein (TIGR04138 family)
MSEELHPLAKLLRDDPRYTIEAYQFVREGLDYAQQVLGLRDKQSSPSPSEEEEEDDDEFLAGEADDVDEEDNAGDDETRAQPKRSQHVTGQQLCHALRHYAVEQFGLLAKLVLNSWGLHATSDFGEIVYNLIGIEAMSKSESDRREDFNDVYDFEEAFVKGFQFPKSTS